MVKTRSENETTARQNSDNAATVQGKDRSRISIVPIMATLAALLLAGFLGWAMWGAYMSSPWTRDATVRVYVAIVAPEVAGRITELPIADNQIVHRGDTLMVIDPTNFKIAVKLAEAAAEQARANAQNADIQAKRREAQSELSVSREDRQTYQTTAMAQQAQYQQALANLDQAKVNLERTQIRSPVNGWVTNLLVRVGDYATVGQNRISVVDADSFWIDGYFEESNISSIRVGDPAKIKLMSYNQIIPGRVSSISRAITVPNAVPDPQGLASVNPIFTWVRLAQRIPVRVQIDEVPDSVHLAAGMTATVQVTPRLETPTK